MNADSVGLLAFSVLYLKQRGVPAGKAAAAGAAAALSGGPTGLLVPIVVGGRQSGDTSLPSGSGATMVPVPDATGHDDKEAGELIKNAKLVPDFRQTITDAEPKGMVVYQKPEDGEYAPAGSRVLLVVAQPSQQVAGGEDGKIDKLVQDMADVKATAHAALAKLSEYTPPPTSSPKPAPTRT